MELKTLISDFFALEYVIFKIKDTYLQEKQHLSPLYNTKSSLDLDSNFEQSHIPLNGYSEH